MARKSRKVAAAEPVCEAAPLQIFPTAIYARLSVENSGKSEKVDVITNQIEICKSYIAGCPYLDLVDVYVDNGRTGTVFDRPEFNRLMTDIKSGRIKCLVVRDLSRFGRDYIETGTYLERIFPQIGLRFIAIKGTNEEVLASLEGYRGRSEMFDRGLDELTTVTKYLADFGVPAENFAVDLTIARGLDYYTGTVYETTLLDHPEIGSVCSGGRYDNLAEYYTDKQLPGVGISIGLTRLFYVLGEQGMLNPDLPTAPADVLILPMTDDLSAAIGFATALRENGIRAQIHGENKKFKQKISYADKLGIPYVIFLGEDEINAGVVACKDMATGEQTKLDPAATIYRIKAGLAEKEKGAVILG